MSTPAQQAARVTRVNGPLVEVAGLPVAAMHDIVEIGTARLPGEIVAIRGATATVQAYEYTGGIAPGDPARSRGEPLSAPLGPHLLGGVFDGLLRPLSAAGAWLDPARPPAAGQREFGFTPSVRDGETVAEGAELGDVANPGQVPYRVLVPPGVSGVVTGVRPPGPAALRCRDRQRRRHRGPAHRLVAGAGPSPICRAPGW